MVATLKLQMELMKQAAELDKQRIDSFEAHVRLTENRYAMFWAGRVTNLFDQDHNDPRYLDYRPPGGSSSVLNGRPHTPPSSSSSSSASTQHSDGRPVASPPSR